MKIPRGGVNIFKYVKYGKRLYRFAKRFFKWKEC